jgi:hypothetical protein
MSNDDRNSGNYNLMVKATGDKYEFWAIDHGAIFHTGTQEMENYPLTLEDSLLNSPLLPKLYQKKQLFDREMHEELKKSWYICTTLCKENYHEIINSIPEQWSINKHLLSFPCLISNLFLCYAYHKLPYTYIFINVSIIEQM